MLLGVVYSSTRWYRKASNTLNFTNWNSSGPKIYKINLIFTMVNRLFKINSGIDGFTKDIEELRDSFLRSDYPQWIVNKYINIALNKTKNLIPTVPQRKLYLGIRYHNQRSEQFSKTISRIISKHLGFIKIIPFFKKGKTLISLFSRKIKSDDPLTSKGVYQIPCSDCESVYIGETSRPFKVRLKEHRHNCVSQKVSSAVADHFKSGHFFDFENSQVIYKQTHNRKRKIAEALLIHNNHTIPGNKSSYELSLFV